LTLAALLVVAIFAGAAASVSTLLHSPQGGVSSQSVVTPANSYSVINSPTSIVAQLGKTFIIQLSSDAGSTGYDWNVTTSSGIRYINYTVIANSTAPGESQERDYFFRALQRGNQTITLVDRRLFAPYNVSQTIFLQVSVS